MKYGVLSIDVAVQVDLDQHGGGHLAARTCRRVDQEVMLRTRDAGRDVGEDHVVPAVDGDQAIERGQIDTEPLSTRPR